MKAIVLAAGRGERMRPLTDRVPKPLLRAGGRSLIEWQILALVRAGIRDIVVNVSHLADRITQALGAGERLGARIVYSHEPVALETAGGIVNALPLLGQQAFIAINADIYTRYDYAALRPIIGTVEDSTTPWAAHLVLVDNPAHHLQGDFSLTAEGKVGSDESPRLTYSGIGVFQARFFAGIAPGERQPLAPLLYAAARAGRLHGERYHGVWMDIGTPERLACLQSMLSHSHGDSAHG